MLIPACAEQSTVWYKRVSDRATVGTLSELVHAALIFINLLTDVLIHIPAVLQGKYIVSLRWKG